MATKPQQKTEQKQEPQQNPTIKVPPELKEELDKMKGDAETHADVIRRLMIAGSVKDAPSEGMVLLKMTEQAYQQLVAFQSSTIFRDTLLHAKVS